MNTSSWSARVGGLLAVLGMALTAALAFGAAPAGAAPPPKPPPSACPTGQAPSYPPGACTLVLDKNAAAAGQTVAIVQACGYKAGSAVTLVLAPTGGGKKVTIGKRTADVSGCLTGQSFVVPSAKVGAYILRATGVDPNGAVYELVTSFQVTNSPTAVLSTSQVASVRPAVSDSRPLLLGVGALALLALGSGCAARFRRNG